MKKLLLTGAVLGAMALLPINTAKAGDNHSLRADDHAPIGIMGDHMHKAGDFMISARAMRMEMKDNRDGDLSLSPEDIVTRFANPFAPPPTLRVVPTEMTTDMVMLGAMYAPTDDLTLMLMGHYIDREMDHITFQGMMGTTRLGTFTTEAKGWGDTKASALIRLYEDNTHHVHLNAGLSLPTGSITEEDQVLTPMNTTPTLRLPYAMQLGTGTFDLHPGITYYGSHQRFGWGTQYMGRFALGDNDEDYSWGDKHLLNIWGSYLITPAVSVSARITAEHESQINGMDNQITAPVQTANPDNFGGKRLSTSFGINTVVPNGMLKGHRFSAEVTLPVYQNLNGPQLERDHMIMLGWSKAF
jgi:hypothetical protein